MNPCFKFAEPVLVSSSAPNESRWGVHQFPALNRLPDGRILLMYSDAPDQSETHGCEAPGFVSADEGLTWTRYVGPLAVRRPHFSITALPGGEHLVVAARPYWDMASRPFDLPKPLTESFVYQKMYTFSLDDAPDDLKDYFRYLPAERWNVSTGKWEETTVCCDTQNLIFVKKGTGTVLPRTFIEQPLTCFDGEVFWADYKPQYPLPGGVVAAKRASWCMVSDDNGRSFKRRGVIAADLENQDLMGEPTLALTRDKRLLCVVRRADHEQKPMVITWSSDHGHTWSRPESFCEFGVFPYLLPLKCGAMVLSYGRPGVDMRISPDGNGEDWTDPYSLVPDMGPECKTSCGYTSLLALSDDTFLIAYSDWRRKGEKGQTYKDILVRKVKVQP